MRHAAALLLATALCAPALAAPSPAVPAPESAQVSGPVSGQISDQVSGSAASLEAAILDYQAVLARACPAATFSRGFAARLDLNGDGRPDAILSGRFMDCPSGPVVREGEEAPVRFALSRADGTYALRDGRYRAVAPVLAAGGLELELTQGGAVCARVGYATLPPDLCRERVRFDGEAMASLAWTAADAPPSVPVLAQLPARVPVRVATADLPPPGEPTARFGGGDPFDHNGSVVRVDAEAGTIVYDNPKPALRGLVRNGTVLFEGRIGNPGPVSGTAYAFKDGCPPAAYPVKGQYAGGSAPIVLHGPGPARWAGCEVVSYSERSPHAKLVFNLIIPD